MKHPELIAVIPVYNEAGRLEPLVAEWAATFERLQICYVMRCYNDASTDCTKTVLQQLAQKNAALQIINYAVNSGHGPVLFRAYAEATSAAWVFQIDGDHELDCTTFEELWKQRHSYELLLGERSVAHKNVFRKGITTMAAFLVGAFFGRVVRDVNCPYRLLRASFLKEALRYIAPGSFAPNVLLTAFAVRNNARIMTAAVEPTGLFKPQRRWQPPWRMIRGGITTAFDLMRIKFQK